MVAPGASLIHCTVDRAPGRHGGEGGGLAARDGGVHWLAHDGGRLHDGTALIVTLPVGSAIDTLEEQMPRVTVKVRLGWRLVRRWDDDRDEGDGLARVQRHRSVDDGGVVAACGDGRAIGRAAPQVTASVWAFEVIGALRSGQPSRSGRPPPSRRDEVVGRVARAEHIDPP